MGRSIGRTVGRAAVVVPLAIVLTQTVATAAPNPYGDSSASSVVTLDDRGGYQVIESRFQELHLDAELSFRGAMPDAVRLPDDPAHALPGLLTPGTSEFTARVNGAEVEVTVEHIGHRLSVEHPAVPGQGNRDKVPKGDYRAELRYQRDRASVPAVTGAMETGQSTTWVQIFSRGDVELRGNDIVGVRCVRYRPDMSPCGRATSTGWMIPAAEVGPATAPGVPMPVVIAVDRSLALEGLEPATISWD